MTPTDIVTASRDLYNATSDSYFSDTQIYNWLLIAEQELASKAWCIESISSGVTVASTQSYALPTNAFAIKRISVNGKKLKRITGRMDDSITLSNSASATLGWPIYYTDFTSVVYMRPIPDAVYTITWQTYNLPSTPSASGTIDVPIPFHMWLCDYVLYRMFMKDKDVQSAALCKQQWDMHVTDSIAHMKRIKRTDSLKTVQDEETLPVTIMGEA